LFFITKVFACFSVFRSYQPGEEISVSVLVTANHKGYFTFRLCRNNNVNRDPDQVVQLEKQCFIRKGHVVGWLAGSNPSKKLKYNIKVYLYRAVLKRQSLCFKWLPLETTGSQ